MNDLCWGLESVLDIYCAGCRRVAFKSSTGCQPDQAAVFISNFEGIVPATPWKQADPDIIMADTIQIIQTNPTFFPLLPLHIT